MEEVLAALAGSGQQRGENGRDIGAELRAEASGDLAVDDGGAEILLRGVVGGWDVGSVEEDEEAVPMLAIAGLETASVGRVGLLGEECAEDEPSTRSTNCSRLSSDSASRSMGPQA